MTDKATFVINGNEKIVQHLLVRAEGVYFSSEESKIGNQILGGAEIRTKNGSWVSFETSRNGVISVKIDKKRKFPATVLLKAFGIESDDEIRALFKDSDTNPELSYIESTLLKDVTRSKEEAAIEIYKKMKPGEPAILEDSMNYLNAIFFNPSRYSLGKVGRFKINQKFNLDTPNDETHRLLTKED
jgi:DNA-directed RNA polymerase subunit beta